MILVAKLLEEVIIKDFCLLSSHSLREVWLCPLEMMVESELRNQQYLVAILNDVTRPHLALLFANFCPQTRFEKFWHKIVDVQYGVSVRDATQDVKPWSNLRHYLSF
jgi:hypothetical protein